ncbi:MULTISPECIES: permease-like cell division protein FtsX [unclassified Sporosarcina]|uniref:permease-like cell division protein FtsX n=1 Tax=unclassified Sporosarcina TaxID=2647733 RepID=UPI000C166837|nr:MULTISPECIES: permease-like cell division protein FtsX [unclassified Sporosarcina]PID14805.1 cell division protein FtsX [Sporosarcina sp. P34]PID24852.1 cell division protein FtsX [Sporosarcina sp. P7]
MKARTLRRHFKESFKSLGRNRWMTFASASAVTVTLLLVGVFLVIMMNLNQLAESIEQDVEIKVIVDLAADEVAVADLEEKIRKTDGVLDVQFSSNTEELDNMIEGYGDEFGLFKQDNPLRHAFYVKAAEPQQTASVAEKIEAYDYTHEVNYGKGKVEKLFNVLNTGRNIGFVLVIALLLTATFLISNTIRITITARRREIEIMKLVGAKNSFVRIPFLFEGMWLGVLGAILPMVIVTVSYFNLYVLLEPKLQGELFQLLGTTPFIYQLNGLMLFMGVFIGVWGSFMSVRKFLKA